MLTPFQLSVGTRVNRERLGQTAEVRMCLTAVNSRRCLTTGRSSKSYCALKLGSPSTKNASSTLMGAESRVIRPYMVITNTKNASSILASSFRAYGHDARVHPPRVDEVVGLVLILE